MIARHDEPERGAAMRREDITMGMRVTAPDRLVRHVDHKREGRRRGEHWKGWVYTATRWSRLLKPQPVDGIVIGMRTVYEGGWRSFLGEEGVAWHGEGKTRTQVLVAEHLRRNPARVWLEDLTVAEYTWSVRDTLTGATYPQPNKLIAREVARLHGNCEVIPG